MAVVPNRIGATVWHLLPAVVRRKLSGEGGRRFRRFVIVAVAAVAASQISLAVLVGLAGISAGTAAFISSAIGALVSYVLTRWAWERKGRPDLLRETLPFWIVALAAWSFMSLVSHEASIWSHHMGHSHWEHVAVVNGAYFLANCVTFVARFAIFHYVLFARRGDKAQAAQVLSPSLQVAEAELPADPDSDSGRPEQERLDQERLDQERAEPSLELAGERRAEPPRR